MKYQTVERINDNINILAKPLSIHSGMNDTNYLSDKFVKHIDLMLLLMANF